MARLYEGISIFIFHFAIMRGTVVGIALWAVLFLPLSTFGIQPSLDSLILQSPNVEVYDIASHFENTYYLIVGGSFLFHIVYGVILGYISGRLSEIRFARGTGRKMVET